MKEIANDWATAGPPDKDHDGDQVDVNAKFAAAADHEFDWDSEIGGKNGDAPQPAHPATDGKNGDGKATAKKPDPVDRFELETCAALMAADIRIEYLIEWLLVAAQPCIVAGPRKAMKTSILLDLALSLASGGFFLGKFRVVEPTSVCFLSAESGRPTIKETIARIGQTAGTEVDHLDNLHLGYRVPLLASIEQIDLVEEMVERFGIGVLIIDPLYFALSGEHQSNLAAQGAELRGISELCQERGVTLILADHSRKDSAYSNDPLDISDISGAAKAEYARQWLLLNRREPYEDGTGEHRLWLRAGGSAGHSGLWGVDISEGLSTDLGGRHWQVDVLTRDEVQGDTASRREEEAERKRQAAVAKDKEKLLRAAAKRPDGDTSKQLRALAGLNGPKFDAALAMALDHGDIVPCCVHKPNRKAPYEGYKLAE